MNKDLLTFNGKNIIFRRINGQYWIAVKSVCEALNVNYNRQYQNIQSDPILGPAFANQQMQVDENQKRKMGCLPEHLIYGWIFSIKSSSEILIEYKKECYDVLFNYFHGTIIRRNAVYAELVKGRKRLYDLEKRLSSSPDYNEYIGLKMRQTRLWKNLHNISDISDLFEDETDD